jgi:hypothetical protein
LVGEKIPSGSRDMNVMGLTSAVLDVELGQVGTRERESRAQKKRDRSK